MKKFMFNWVFSKLKGLSFLLNIWFLAALMTFLLNFSSVAYSVTETFNNHSYSDFSIDSKIHYGTKCVSEIQYHIFLNNSYCDEHTFTFHDPVTLVNFKLNRRPWSNSTEGRTWQIYMESCGRYFRKESQLEKGEAAHDGERFSYATVWEYKGVGETSELHKEDLKLEFVTLSTRSYK